METLNILDKQASQLLEKLPDILTKGLEYGGDLAVRFVQYSLWKESLPFMLLVILIFLYCFLVKKLKTTKDITDDRAEIIDVAIGMAHIVSIVTIIWIFIMAIFSTIAILKLIYVPEIYILEHFT